MRLNDSRVQAMAAVSDLERANDFYQRRLGLVPGPEEEGGVRYPVRGRRRALHLSLAPRTRGPPRRPSPAGSWTTWTKQSRTRVARRRLRALRPARNNDRRTGHLRQWALQGRLDQGPPTATPSPSPKAGASDVTGFAARASTAVQKTQAKNSLTLRGVILTITGTATPGPPARAVASLAADHVLAPDEDHSSRRARETAASPR